MIAANNPSLMAWIPVPQGSDFPLQNIPFGIASIDKGPRFVATRIGNHVVNLAALFRRGYFKDLPYSLEDFDSDTLNAIMKYGKLATRDLRNRLSHLFEENNQELQSNSVDCKEILVAANEVTLHLPIEIGDYTDFYSSKNHAFNMGAIIRGPENALQPNWVHLPVGYHGMKK